MRPSFMPRPFLIVLLLGLVSAANVYSAIGQEMTTTWNQEELTLENGLRVLLLPHPGSGLVASNVFVGAGSTREEDRYAGSSHFLEHVLFNGTERRTQEEIYAFGDRLGAYNNATTSLEYTHYMMVAPTEKLAGALDLQADMLFHSTLPPEKFEKERGIVLEELSKDKDDPDYRQQRLLGGLTFGENSDFARPVLGTAETIAALPRDNVVEYYRRQYVPSNMRLVLMGDFERDRALDLIKDLFRTPAGVSTLEPLPGPRCALQSPSRLVTAPVDAPKVALEFLIDIPEGSPEVEAELALLAQIDGGDKSGRLERALNREPGIAHENANAALTYRQGARLLTLSVQLPEAGELEEATRRMLATLKSLDTIGKEELAAARIALLTEELSQLEQLHYYAIFHGDRLWHMPEDFTPRYLTALETSEAGSLGASAAKLLDGARLQAVAAGSGVADSLVDLGRLEPSPELAVWLHPSKDRESREIERHRPRPIEADQPPTVTTLENGLTVIHAASTSTRMFAIHLLVKNRSQRESEGLAGIADLLHRSMANTVQTADDGGPSVLSRIGATLKVADNPWIPYDDYYTTPLYSFVRLECMDVYYREAIRILASMLKTPCIDSTAIENAKTEMISAIRRQAQRPSEMSAKRLSELLFPRNPLSRPVMGDEATVNSITPEVLAGFQSTYLEPAYLVLAVVGDVPRDEVLETIRKELGAPHELPNIGNQLTVQSHVTADSAFEEIEGGGNQSSIRMAKIVKVDSADRWPLIVASRILSDRMAQDLRETRGLAYSLGISVDFLDADIAELQASMGTRPENVEEARKGMLSYFNASRLQATPEEIETASNKYISRMRMRRVTSMGQAFTLSQDYFLYGDVGYSEKEAQGLEAVTSAAVNHVVGRYFAAGPMVTVVAR